jgi:hypothetical protein
MSAYIFELPTTGSFTFTDILIDKENKYAQAIANATAARASMRSVLKASKRAEDSQKDYLRLVKVGHQITMLSSFDGLADSRRLSSSPVRSNRMHRGRGIGTLSSTQ